MEGGIAVPPAFCKQSLSLPLMVSYALAIRGEHMPLA